MSKVISFNTVKSKRCLKCVASKNKSDCNNCNIIKQTKYEYENQTLRNFQADKAIYPWER